MFAAPHNDHADKRPVIRQEIVRADRQQGEILPGAEDSDLREAWHGIDEMPSASEVRSRSAGFMSLDQARPFQALSEAFDSDEIYFILAWVVLQDEPLVLSGIVMSKLSTLEFVIRSGSDLYRVSSSPVEGVDDSLIRLRLDLFP